MSEGQGDRFLVPAMGVVLVLHICGSNVGIKILQPLNTSHVHFESPNGSLTKRSTHYYFNRKCENCRTL
jgi:hypothetical protein